MTPGVQALLSGALSFGVPLLLAARELVALGRVGHGPSDPRDAGPTPPPPCPGRDPCPAPLPACLVAAARTDVVAATVARQRALEHA